MNKESEYAESSDGSGLLSLSYSDLYDMTNSIIQIPEIRMQLSEGRATLHLHVRQYVHCVGKRLHTLDSHPTLRESQGFSRGTVKKETLLIRPTSGFALLITRRESS